MLAATVNFRDYLALEDLWTALLTHLKCFINKMRMPSKFALNFGKGKNCSVLAPFRFGLPEMAEEAYIFYAHKVVNTEIKSTPLDRVLYQLNLMLRNLGLNFVWLSCCLIFIYLDIHFSCMLQT